MAVVVGNEYDHIDVVTGSNTNRHFIKDSTAREEIDDLKSAIAQSYNLIKVPYDFDFNIIENGINRTTGANYNSTARCRTTYIPVVAGQTYCIKLNTTAYNLYNPFTYTGNAVGNRPITDYLLDDQTLIFNAEDAETSFRTAFCHFDDDTKTITEEDREIIKAALSLYTFTDYDFVVKGTPADSEAVGRKFGVVNGRISDLKKDVIQVVNGSTIDMTDYGTDTYPTGWRNGYYGSTDGTWNTSNLYLGSLNKISFPENTESAYAQAPDGYGIRVTEFGSDGTTMLNNYGSSSGENLTQFVRFNVSSNCIYGFTIGRFDNKDAPNYNTDEFLSNAIIEYLPSIFKKKKRTGDFEFFSVTVPRPLSYGGEDLNTTTEIVECVLRLPATYNPTGEPTRLVLACHGASGYIRSSTNTWYNSNWKAFMDDLLAAGYAVFDANVLPTSFGTDVMGRALGAPAYVNVLKASYDYIVKNYNVTEKIFAHGTSMGGVGASAFVNAYPHLVLAESSFAGRDLSQYIYQIATGYYEDDDDFAVPWGYSDLADLNADKWSHIDGSAPSLSLLKYTNGVLDYPPDRETEYLQWLEYYGEIQSHGKDDAIGQYTAYRITPYKAWDSWNDNIGRTKAKLILQKAFRAGSSVPYEVVVYDNATHTELSYGQIADMRNQLIAWYKRWE